MMLRTATLIASVLFGFRVAAGPHSRSESFDRATCETFILGKRGAAHRAERTRWLIEQTPLAFELANNRLPRHGFHDGDPAYALHQARDVSPEERDRILTEATDRLAEFLKASAATPSSPLSALQAAALGIAAPGPSPADHLFTIMTAPSPAHLTLETYEAGHLIGTVDLAVDDVKLGYRGDPAYWIFNEDQQDVEHRRKPSIRTFLSDLGTLVFRATSHGRPILYTVQTMEPEEDDDDPWTMVHVEIYTWRRVDPNLIEDDPVQIPPRRGPDDRGLRLTSIGLRMNRVVVDDAPGVDNGDGVTPE